MSDAAPAAAPAAPAAPANTSSDAPAKAAAEAPAPSAWTDDDERDFTERYKRSPYAKIKVSGQEREVDLKELRNHAQRGVGASKLVEETKARTAELEKRAAEVEKREGLVKRALAGDFEARQALGMASPQEIRARQQEMEAIPEPVRQLLEEHNAAKSELEQLKAEAEKRQQAEEQRREQTEMLATKRQAVNFTHAVLQGLGLDKNERVVERMLPQVAGAIADLSDEGLEIGVDMTEELVMQRVKERLGGWEDEVFSALEPKRLAGYLGKWLPTAQTPQQIVDTVGIDSAKRIAKALAQYVHAKRAQPGTVVVPPQREPEKPREERQTLKPRWMR